MVQRVPNPVHPHRILCLSMLFHLRRYEEVQDELVGDLEVRDGLCPKQPLTNTSGHVVAITVRWFVQDPDGFLQTAKVRQMSALQSQCLSHRWHIFLHLRLVIGVNRSRERW